MAEPLPRPLPVFTGEPDNFAWIGRLLARLFGRKREGPREARFPEDAELAPPPVRGRVVIGVDPAGPDGGVVIHGDGSGEALPPFEERERNDNVITGSPANFTVQLSQHFKLSEFTESDTAKRFGLDNTPPPEVLANLYAAAAGMEQVREALGGKPILITSGYRAPEVNAKVGSKPGSAHTQGFAVDFKCPSVGKPAEIVAKLAASGIVFDQLIDEFSAWVHISFDPRARGQVLRIFRGTNGKAVTVAIGGRLPNLGAHPKASP